MMSSTLLHVLQIHRRVFSNIPTVSNIPTIVAFIVSVRVIIK
ncbi:hypothetical protein [Candidatus Neoehrlichia procyonis]|uniref:Uncharacterized protein n=1 Tax=Candidatus Neoehrlichia procyonis str. RAC413 TaxID=1359163 RepID=A0A0F3NPD7_9RICK|nr:hypothetical protein [Candidatus Neoehrlichia lotoris]KJV68774.1 hypothetical protein NLO413_0138 [Candidatus Neoehrlichia lotoris str. RAC413]